MIIGLHFVKEAQRRRFFCFSLTIVSAPFISIAHVNIAHGCAGDE